jgi:hypothetical protein
VKVATWWHEVGEGSGDAGLSGAGTGEAGPMTRGPRHSTGR